MLSKNKVHVDFIIKNLSELIINGLCGLNINTFVSTDDNMSIDCKKEIIKMSGNEILKILEETPSNMRDMNILDILEWYNNL